MGRVYMRRAVLGASGMVSALAHPLPVAMKGARKVMTPARAIQSRPRRAATSLASFVSSLLTIISGRHTTMVTAVAIMPKRDSPK